MLNTLKQRLQQTAHQIRLQENKVVKSALSNEEISASLEKMKDDTNSLMIDEQDFAIFVPMKTVHLHTLECTEAELAEQLPALIDGLKAVDCVMCYIDSPPDFTLEQYHFIVEQICSISKAEVECIIGAGFESDQHIKIALLFGYQYSDEDLIEAFIEELKENPNIRIAALQRKYSLGFTRAVRNLDAAKARLGLAD